MTKNKNIFSFFLLLMLMLCFATQAEAGTRYYVDPTKMDNSRTGDSWLNAKGNLEALLTSLTSGVDVEVWVITDVYELSMPTSTFNLKKGVKLYGGFYGTENMLSERVVNANGYMINETILYGANKAYHVVTTEIDALAQDTVIDGFTIMWGNANGSNLDSSGGGIFNDNSSPLITNCIFSENKAYNVGGAIYNYANNNTTSSPVIINCTFTKNTATNQGGAIYNEAEANNGTPTASPIITNCTFTENTADFGGAINNYIYSSGGFYATSLPIITNCTFSGNIATNQGGAIYSDTQASGAGNSAFLLVITNSTFIGNTATNQGGAIYNRMQGSGVDHSTSTIVNTIIYGNSASAGKGFFIESGSLFFQNSIVQPENENHGTLLGDSPITADPKLVSVDIIGNPTNVTANVHHYKIADRTSPALNAGLIVGEYPNINGQIITVPKTDQLGTNRLDNKYTTIGAFEPKTYFVKKIEAGKKDGYDWDNAFSDLKKAMGKADVGSDIYVASGDYLPGASPTDSFNLKKGIKIYGGFDPDSSGENLLSKDIKKFETVLDGNNTNDHVVAGGAEATSVDTSIDGFKITRGKYNGGMFNSYSSPTITNCNFSKNSGHTGGGVSNWYSSPVITNCIFLDNTASFGGGIFNISSSPIITNCIFLGNAGNRGGGITNNGSSPIITNCTFSGNIATDYGGGVLNYANTSSIITNCIFLENKATNYGGGIYNSDSSLIVADCTFTENIANIGGGISNVSSSPVIKDTIFLKNEAIGGGGAIYSSFSSPIVIGCIFSENTTIQNGGGIHNHFSDITITNSTFTKNTAGSYGHGGGMFNDSSNSMITNTTFSENSASDGGMFFFHGGSQTIINSTLTRNTAIKDGGGLYNVSGHFSLINTILWRNSATYESEFYNHSGTVFFKNSISSVELQGENNITTDPKLISVDIDGKPTIYPDKVHYYKIEDSTSSALNAGLPVGQHRFNDIDITVPAFDQLAQIRPRNPNHIGKSTTIGSYESELDRKAEEVFVSPDVISLKVGSTISVTATVSPDKATDKDVAWTFTTPNIIRTIGSGNSISIEGLIAGNTILTATTNNVIIGTASVTVTGSGGGVPVTGITLNKTTMPLKVGESETLIATVLPENATEKTVYWYSYDTDIATVGNNGKVTAKKAGETSVRASTSNNIEVFCHIDVTDGGGNIPVTGVSLNKNSTTIDINKTEKLTATIAPANATNPNVTWSSNSTAIASVLQNGTVTGITAGTATVTVVTSNGKTDTCSVTVRPISDDIEIPVERVVFKQPSISLLAGETKTITVDFTPADATNQIVTFISSNPAVVKVNETDSINSSLKKSKTINIPQSRSATITAMSAGIATVTVTTDDGGKTASCTVSVSASDPVNPRPIKPVKPVLPPDTPPTIEPVIPEITVISDDATEEEKREIIEELIGDMPGWDIGDVGINDGVVTVNPVIPEKMIEDEIVTDDTCEYSVDTFLIPIFTAQAETIGGTVAVGFEVSGYDLFKSTPSTVSVMKVLSPKMFEYFKYNSNPENFADGMFTIMLGDVIHEGVINSSTKYMLVLFIKDGGKYDLDKQANGIVIDPPVLTDYSESNLSDIRPDGGSGCNTSTAPGYKLLAMLIILLLFSLGNSLKKKK